MASKFSPFSAFFSGLFLFFFLGLAPAIGQNHTEKVGVCPGVLESKDCPVECRTDEDCPDVHKCCTAGCTSVCTIPNAPGQIQERKLLTDLSSALSSSGSWDPMLNQPLPPLLVFKLPFWG
ncbi:supwaprin-a-like isoform X2 [Petaurus breviceps papuanus]|uniref:supwaprin-a-like isoform X2 n=1 Tax=Petaurus breviceps papuanus TaxID=3040969 RepID=UPI0036DA1D96